MERCRQGAGFTLIELSIVLVIIGLIIGGVLVGQDLVRAAGERAQITQIEKYNTSVNTFRDKYGGLPGDLNAAGAAQFGFESRGTAPGEGDSNGVIEGNTGGGTYACGYCVATGETLSVWGDLATARLVDGTFLTNGEANGLGTPTIMGSGVSQFLPPAKIGNGNYVYVWSGGPTIGFGGIGSNSVNYFAISAVSELTYWEGDSTPGLSVKQAYDIDKKIDDGFPQSGRVTAVYIDANTNLFGAAWAGSGGQTGAPYTTMTAGSPTSCYDNSSTANGTPGISGAQQHYSLEISNGNNVNCALSFQFQ